MKGIVAVSLGLIGLQVLLTSNVAQLLPAVSYLASAAAKWIDPTVPLIPAKATATTAAKSTNTSTSSAAEAQGLRAAGLGQDFAKLLAPI